MHQSEITNVKFYNKSEGTFVVSCEEQGAVRWMEITKRSLFGGYHFTSEYLFKTKLQNTSSIAVFEPNKLYPNKYCDESKVIAFGGTNLVVLVTMKPIDGLFTVSKPSFVKENSVPYMDWGFGLTPSHREKTVPILAIAWDKTIQLIYINDEGTSLEIDGIFYSEKTIINCYFIADSVLFVLFESKDGREVKILYTPKLYPQTYQHLENLDHKTRQKKLDEI